MKKLDEMDRKIQLRSEQISYHVILLILSAWTVYNCWQVLAHHASYHPLPGLIVCLAVSVQSISQLAIKQRMISGDEEYREPNKLLWTIAGALAVTAILLFAGTYVLVMASGQ